MKHLACTGVGILVSAVISVVLAYCAAATVGVSRHVFESWPWLFGVSALPCALGCLILSFMVSTTRGDRLFLHALAFAVAFFATATAGSVGAITVEAFQRGLSRVNVEGYLVWCWVYAAAFLPVTYPLTFWLQQIIHRIHKRHAA